MTSGQPKKFRNGKLLIELFKSSEQFFTKEEQRYFEKLTEYSNKGG